MTFLKKSQAKAFGLGALSGLLLSLGSAIIYNYSPLIFVALIPMLYAWNRYSSTSNLIAAFLGYNLVYNSLCFFWIPLSLTEMWKFPLLLSGLLFLPIALFSEFQFLITAIVRNKLYQKYGQSWPTMIAIALVYAASEKLSSIVFPDGIGTSFFSVPILKQSFDLSGVSLLSFLYFITNEVILLTTRTKIKKTLMPLVSIYIILLCYGAVRGYQYQEATSRSPKIKVLVIQPNLNHKIRNAARDGNAEKAQEVLNKQYAMTLKGINDHPETNIIVWPETTYPYYFNTYSNLFEEKTEQEFKNFLHDKPITLFFGSFGKTGEPIRITNNLYSVSHTVEPMAINHWEKTVLFPFGEYIPGLKTFPWLKTLFPKANTPEASLTPLINSIQINQQTSIKVGAAICYEVLFSDTLMVNALKDAELIINISNESYFHSFGEPQLNLLHAGIRSIETRIPWVRSANTGISGFIAANGEILHITPMDQEEIIYQELPLTKSFFGKTLYLQYGDWFGLLSLIALGGTILILIFTKNRNL